MPLLLSLAITLLAGCGDGHPAVYRVRGKVMIRGGPPLVGGLIVLESVDEHGLNGDGAITAHGSYEITTFQPNDGAVDGQHLVMISPAIQHAPACKKYEETIHERYLDFGTSGLSVRVSKNPEENVFDFVLDPPGP